MPPTRLRTLHVLLAATVTASVLVMAAIAGRYLSGFGGISVHGVLGNVVFGLSVALVVVAGLRRRGVVAAVVLAALVFAQTGLGYVGRDNREARAWHVPVGVLIMGTAGFSLARTLDE